MAQLNAIPLADCMKLQKSKERENRDQQRSIKERANSESIDLEWRKTHSPRAQALDSFCM